jgi:rare lipoprotein A
MIPLASVTGKDISNWLCCILFLALLPLGCSPAGRQSSTGHRPESADYRLPPTQRPYVIDNKRYYPIPSADGYSEQGIASWYGPGFHGKKTSNGETYDMHSMTAAHKTLPMNTMLLVKNLENGRHTVVRVNDRGPFVRGRIVDLSYKAAEALGIAQKGITRVQAIALGEETIKKRGGPPTLVYQDLSVGEFYVQVGAFVEKSNAANLQKRFTAAGHTAVVHKSVETEPLFYRVQVYAGKTMQNAKQAEQAMLEYGYAGAFIIAR